MNDNNEVKKLLLVVLVDIEILFKNDVYKNYSDSLKSIKKNMMCKSTHIVLCRIIFIYL